MAVRRYRLVMTGSLLAGALALGGCSALGIERTDSSPGATSSATPTGADPTQSPSESPTEQAFGDDAGAPTDGVGSLTFGQVDRWSLTNEDDNIYAAYLSMPQSPALAGAQQAQVAQWMDEYRAFIEGAEAPEDVTGTPEPTATTATAEPTAVTPTTDSPDLRDPAPTMTPTGPVQQTQAGSATPNPTGGATTSATATATVSASSEPGGATSSTSPADAAQGPDGTGPDAMSMRVVPQLLSDGRVVGVRLYARLHNGEDVREHVRTYWADGDTIVPGSQLFTDVGAVRQLVLAQPGGAAAGGLSDEDLFGAVAFTPQGDAVLYLPGQTRSDQRVQLEADTVAGLLSETGRGARESAQDANVSTPDTTSGGSASASSGASAGESSQTSETSATTVN